MINEIQAKLFYSVNINRLFILATDINFFFFFLASSFHSLLLFAAAAAAL